MISPLPENAFTELSSVSSCCCHLLILERSFSLRMSKCVCFCSFSLTIAWNFARKVDEKRIEVEIKHFCKCRRSYMCVFVLYMHEFSVFSFVGRFIFALFNIVICAGLVHSSMFPNVFLCVLKWQTANISIHQIDSYLAHDISHVLPISRFCFCLSLSPMRVHDSSIKQNEVVARGT